MKRMPFTDTDTGNDPDFQLYDLATDIGETNNLAAAYPDKVQQLQALLQAERVKAGTAGN